MATGYHRPAGDPPGPPRGSARDRSPKRRTLETGPCSLLIQQLRAACAPCPSPDSAKPVSLEACVVDRKPTSALMKIDTTPFEVDLRGIHNTDDSLDPREWVAINGANCDNEPGLR